MEWSEEERAKERTFLLSFFALLYPFEEKLSFLLFILGQLFQLYGAVLTVESKAEEKERKIRRGQCTTGFAKERESGQPFLCCEGFIVFILKAVLRSKGGAGKGIGGNPSFGK